MEGDNTGKTHDPPSSKAAGSLEVEEAAEVLMQIFSDASSSTEVFGMQWRCLREEPEKASQSPQAEQGKGFSPVMASRRLGLHIRLRLL